MTLKSVLGKYDRKLRRYCKRQLRKKDNSEYALVITENFTVLSSAINSAKGFLSRNGDEGFLPLFFLCRKFLCRDIAVTQDSIIASFSSRTLSILQCEALQSLLFAAAAGLICDTFDYEDSERLFFFLEKLVCLRDADNEELIRGLCRAEKYLGEDPTGDYSDMDSMSRRQYRYAVRRGAYEEGISETEFVKNALRKASAENRHIGFYLPVFPEKKRLAAALVAFQWAMAFLLSLAAVLISGNLLFFPALVIPLYTGIKSISDRLFTGIFPTRFLPCFGDGRKYDKPFIIAVCALLPDEKAAEELYYHLKRLKFCTKNRNVRVILLCDRKSSRTPENNEDEKDIAAACALTDRLNRDFEGGFSLFVRDRVFSFSENEYTGFERKRGAVCELCRYVKNADTGSFGVIHGDLRNIKGCEYMLTLDSDTMPAADTPDRLIAAASHPLNRPVYSAESKRIVAGYGIFVPRVQVSAESACKSRFAENNTFAGSVAYSSGVGDRLFSAYGESVFCGKGLIDIDAFYNTVCDRFDEGRILSHDILEGSVLRTGFSEKSEVTESFPRTVTGYYSRLHRWIRGDIQNMKYLFFPLGKTKLSPRLSPFGRYIVAENVISAVSPVISFILIAASCLCNGKNSLLLLFAALFSLCAGGIIRIAAAVSQRGFSALYERYMCKALTDVTRGFYEIVTSVGFSAIECFVRLDAVCRAVFRSVVSKRHMLQWKTAAAADKSNRKTVAVFAIVTFLCGFFLVLAGNIFHLPAGLFLLAAVPFAVKGNAENPMQLRAAASGKQKKILMKYIVDMWHFYSENVTEKESFLPPDNVWEEPSGKKTKRTSPTNIGLYLTSILAVYDVGLADGDEVLFRVNKTLDTLEKLPKYNGHLYNWYDTEKALPVKPLYVSGVDCGNFLVCLTALKEGLKEIEGSENTVERIEKIIGEGDLSFFADEKRGLFRIGFDCEKNELTPSCYDLYMSEARMTSYLAVAKRQVGVKYWENLSRTPVKISPFVCAGSWSGTMFEYFMPVLFLSHHPFTFCGESVRVSLEAQKREAEEYGIPYGFSESCFFDGGSQEKYGYKAIGAFATGMKPDMKSEAVVSPYSTFLSLFADPSAAMKNLARLKGEGVYGKYGFYEAADYRESRGNPRIIRCFMAHHVGMSIVAAVNFLKDDIFVRRFMRDCSADNVRGLLYEKLPYFPARADRIAKKCRKKL